MTIDAGERFTQGVAFGGFVSAIAMLLGATSWMVWLGSLLVTALGIAYHVGKARGHE
jgi:hypothetical protein